MRRDESRVVRVGHAPRPMPENDLFVRVLERAVLDFALWTKEKAEGGPPPPPRSMTGKERVDALRKHSQYNTRMRHLDELEVWLTSNSQHRFGFEWCCIAAFPRGNQWKGIRDGIRAFIKNGQFDLLDSLYKNPVDRHGRKKKAA